MQENLGLGSRRAVITPLALLWVTMLQVGEILRFAQDDAAPEDAQRRLTG